MPLFFLTLTLLLTSPVCASILEKPSFSPLPLNPFQSLTFTHISPLPFRYHTRYHQRIRFYFLPIFIEFSMFFHLSASCLIGICTPVYLTSLFCGVTFIFSNFHIPSSFKPTPHTFFLSKNQTSFFPLTATLFYITRYC